MKYSVTSKNSTKKEFYQKVKTYYEGLKDTDLETKHELELVLKLMEPYLEQQIDIKPHDPAALFQLSLFEILLRIFKLPDKVDTIEFLALNEHLGKLFSLTSTDRSYKEESPDVYSTLIITENADLHSAVDLLSTAWNNNLVPWAIRDVLVQENMQVFSIILGFFK